MERLYDEQRPRRETHDGMFEVLDVSGPGKFDPYLGGIADLLPWACGISANTGSRVLINSHGALEFWFQRRHAATTGPSKTIQTMPLTKNDEAVSPGPSKDVQTISSGPSEDDETVCSEPPKDVRIGDRPSVRPSTLETFFSQPTKSTLRNLTQATLATSHDNQASPVLTKDQTSRSLFTASQS